MFLEFSLPWHSLPHFQARDKIAVYPWIFRNVFNAFMINLFLSDFFQMEVMMRHNENLKVVAEEHEQLKIAFAEQSQRLV